MIVHDSVSRILLVEDDELVAESLATALAGNGRDVILCGDTAGAAVLLEESQFDSVITDMHLGGAFTFDGLDVAARTKLVQPAASIVMITAFASNDAVEAARAHGARVLAKPFAIDSLEEELPENAAPRFGRVERMPSLEATIRDHLAAPHFQPIMRVGHAGASPYGAEALTRIDAALPLRTPETIFRYAVERNTTAAADIECLRRIFASLHSVDTPNYFMNIHPRSLTDGRFARNIVALARDAGMDLSRVVLEITEQEAVPQSAVARRTVSELRAAGARFALDDVGIAHSHLALIDCIRPSFIKISFDFGASNGRTTRTTLIRNLSNMGRELGCQVIAERIETADDELMARDLDIDLMQGYRFGRPMQAPHLVPELTM